MANRSPSAGKPPLGAQVNRGHPLAQGLELCFLLNEGGGAILKNLGRAANADGTVGSGSSTAWGTAKNGTGLVQAATASNTKGISFSLASAPSTTNFTVEALVRRDATGDGYGTILANSPTNTQGIWITSAGKLDWYVSGDHNSAATLAVGTWYHAVVVVSGTNYSMYVNGVLDSTGTTAAPISLTNYTSSLNDSSTETFVGTMEYLRVWSRTLTPTEVRQLYAQPYGMFQAPRRRVIAAATGSATKSHTTDALLLKTQTKTHSTDSLLLKTQTKTHTTDSLLRAVKTILHTTDALLKGTLTRSHATDALLMRTLTKSHTTDSLLLKSQAKSHTTDAYLQAIGSVTKSHTTDALLKKTQTKSHTSDALLLKTSTRTHSTDSLLQKTQVKTHATDSLLKGTLTRTHSTDSLLKGTSTRTHTTDSLLARTQAKTHSTDSLLASRATRTHTTDAYLAAASTALPYDSTEPYDTPDYTWDGQAIGRTPPARVITRTLIVNNIRLRETLAASNIRVRRTLEV